MKKSTKMKNRYAVMCHRVDCGDETVFQLGGDNGKDWWNTLAKARKAMKADYKLTCEECDVGKDCKRRVGKGEIRLVIPIWDSDTQKMDILSCRWKIVKV